MSALEITLFSVSMIQVGTYKTNRTIGFFRFLASFFAAGMFSGIFQGCSKSGGGFETPEIAQNFLNSPQNFQFWGTAFASANAGFIFASSTGLIASTSNYITVTFAGPALPLNVSSYGAFFDQMNSGSCVLGNISTLIDPTGSILSSDLTATSCSDQSNLSIYLDTSLLQDSAGNFGTTLLSAAFTVDNAPLVTVAATGNTQTSAGIYNHTTDTSLVVSFSKSLVGGSYGATISGTGCTATLGSATVVTPSTGIQIAWPLGNVTAGSVGQTCVLNVSSVMDAAGNADDPNDPNISMSFTIQ